MKKTSELKGCIEQHLKDLHMPTIRTCYTELAEQARSNDQSYENFLLELLERESEVRSQNRIQRLLKESRLPVEKTMDSFDRKRLPRAINGQLESLLEGSFVERCENLLAFGNPGSGKTHLLCALAQELVYNGYRVYYSPCSLLVQELLVAKRDLKLSKILKRLARYQAILIDDIGYVQQNREEMEVLFTLLADRYERSSILLTSNLPFSKWEQIFKDPMTTAAAIDRVVHHSIILELNLSSYRLEHSKKRQQEKLNKTKTTE